MPNGLKDYVKYIIMGDVDAGIAYINPYIEPVNLVSAQCMFHIVIPVYKQMYKENVNFSLIYSSYNRGTSNEYGTDLRNNYYMYIRYSSSNNIIILTHPDKTEEVFNFVENENNTFYSLESGNIIKITSNDYELHDKYGNVTKVKKDTFYPYIIQMKNGEIIEFTIENNKIKKINNSKYGFTLDFYYNQFLDFIEVKINNKKYTKIKFIYEVNNYNQYYLQSIEKYENFVDNSPFIEKYSYNLKYKINGQLYYDISNETSKEYYRYILDSYNIIQCIYHSKIPINYTNVTNVSLSNCETMLIKYDSTSFKEFTPRIINLETNEYVEYYYRKYSNNTQNLMGEISHIVRNNKFVSKYLHSNFQLKNTNEIMIQINDLDNLIINGYYEDNLSGWNIISDNNGIQATTIINNSTVQHIDALLGTKVAKFNSSSSTKQSLSQRLLIDYCPGEKYIFGFWSTLTTGHIRNQSKVIINLYRNNNLLESIEEIIPLTQNFEFNVISISKEYSFNEIEIIFECDTLSIMQIDGVLLKKGIYGIEGKKDENYNLTSIDLSNNNVNIEYNEKNLPIKISNPYFLHDVIITYNEKNLIEEEFDGITTKHYSYDNSNNVTSINISNSDGTRTLSLVYDNYSNLIEKIYRQHKITYNTLINENNQDYKIFKKNEIVNLSIESPKYVIESKYKNNKIINYLEYSMEDNNAMTINVETLYDFENNDLLKISTYMSNNNTMKHIEYTYNEINRKIDSIDFNYKNNIFYSIYNYYDDTYKRIVSQTTQSEHNIYTYDASNKYKLISKNTLENSLISQPSVYYYYEYDEYDRFKCIKYGENHKYTYEYDLYNNISQIRYVYNNNIFNCNYRYAFSDKLTYSKYISPNIVTQQGYSNYMYLPDNDKTTSFFNYNFSLDTSQYMYSEEIQNKFDIYPLNYELQSLEGKNPAYVNRPKINNKYKPYFIYDDIMMRSVYNVNENEVSFHLPDLSSRAFAFSFRPIDLNIDKQYLFSISNMICAYMKKTESGNKVYLNIFSFEYDTNIIINNTVWNRIIMKIDREDISRDHTIRFIYNITLEINGNKYNVDQTSSIQLLTQKLTIGKNSVGEYSSDGNAYYYPFKGRIENLIISKTLLSNISDSLLSRKNDIFTCSSLYDLHKRKKYDIISRDAYIEAYTEYLYNDTSSEVGTQKFYCNGLDINCYYWYDAMGNICHYRQNNKHKYYKYNNRNFLIEEKITNNLDKVTKITNYYYNENGNLMERTIKNGSNEVINLDYYTYNDDNPFCTYQHNNKKIYYNIDRIERYIEEDSDHNIISGKVFTWNGYKLMSTQVYKNSNVETLINYDYNPLGLRSSKVINNLLTQYIYEGNKLIEEITPDYSMKYLYNSQGIYGFIKKTATTESYYYYLKNIMGEIIGIINHRGKVIVQYEYDAYGKLLSTTGTQANTIGVENHIIYKGYYYDDETQLYWVSSRYYSPELCRWISPDSIEYLDPESVNGLNLYCYCFNNPIMYKDSSGHYPEPIGLFGDMISGFSESLGNVIWKHASKYLKNPMTIKQAQKIIRKRGLNKSARALLRDYSDDALNSFKFGKGMAKFGSVLGTALVAIDIGTTIYGNYKSGSDTWVSESVVDVGYTLIQTGIAAACTYFIPGVGWLVGIGINLLLDYIVEETGVIDDIKSWISQCDDEIKGILFGRGILLGR